MPSQSAAARRHDLIPGKNYGSVFVQGKEHPHIHLRMFLNHGGFVAAPSIAEADYIVWTGGDDISPHLYNQKPIDGIEWNNELDNSDTAAYNLARASARDPILIGICRGGQFLNVMNGGQLWQHVDGHNDHYDHICYDVETKEQITLNSVHHQQMIIGPEGNLLTWTEISTRKENYQRVWSNRQGHSLDVEAVWYPKTQCLCFQPHPEYPNAVSTREYFWRLLARYAVPINEE